MTTNDNTPESRGKQEGRMSAYPVDISSNENHPFISGGMTKREVIAMHVMAACITAENSPAPDWGRCAKHATNAADALLEALHE